MVFVGFVTAWRLASWPTSRSPVFVNATTDGTVRLPSADGMTVGSPPSMTATTEFVVPRSMPMIFAMVDRAPGLVRVQVVGVRWSVGRAGSARVGRRLRAVDPGARDGHEGRPDDPIAEAVAAPDLLHDLAVAPAAARDVDDGLVLARIEGRAGQGGD